MPLPPPIRHPGEIPRPYDSKLNLPGKSSGKKCVPKLSKSNYPDCDTREYFEVLQSINLDYAKKAKEVSILPLSHLTLTTNHIPINYDCFFLTILTFLFYHNQALASLEISSSGNYYSYDNESNEFPPKRNEFHPAPPENTPQRSGSRPVCTNKSAPYHSAAAAFSYLNYQYQEGKTVGNHHNSMVNDRKLPMIDSLSRKNIENFVPPSFDILI